MSTDPKDANDAPAVDYVRTQQEIDADLAKRDAEAKAGAATAGGPAGSGDSPKPHGDKLEHARDEAAKG